MKRTVTLLISAMLFVSMLVLGGASKVQAQNTQGQACSLATLNGTYGISLTGFQQVVMTTPLTFATTASLPQAVVGIVTFDGAGLVSIAFTSSSNGSISPNNTASGVYTVDADCTGSLFMSGSTTSFANFVIVAKGNEILAIATNPGAVQTAIIIKAASGCTLATLNGTYGISLTGFQPGFQTPPTPATTASFPQAAVETVTFNGAGFFSVVLVSGSNNGSFSPTRVTASGDYTVNPDCTGSFLLSGTTTSLANFVIVAKGNEILIIATGPGTVQTAIAIKQ